MTAVQNQPHSYNSTVVQTHLSQKSPEVNSRHPWQTPVSGSHVSALPLHWQGRHCGKPQKPSRHWSQVRPPTFWMHVHWPDCSLQKLSRAPISWQLQAGKETSYAWPARFKLAKKGNMTRQKKRKQRRGKKTTEWTTRKNQIGKLFFFPIIFSNSPLTLKMRERNWVSEFNRNKTVYNVLTCKAHRSRNV